MSSDSRKDFAQAMQGLRSDRYISLHYDDYLQALEAAYALAAQPAPVDDDGEEWLSAPLEPTAEMIRRGLLFGMTPNQITVIFQEMLQAAPTPATGSGGYDRAMIADYLEDYADGLFEDHEVTVESAREQARLLRSAASTAAQQNTVEVAPVCWSLSGFIHDDDGRPIGTDEPRISWGAECPDETEGWSPLYGAPAQPAPVGWLAKKLAAHPEVDDNVTAGGIPDPCETCGGTWFTNSKCDKCGTPMTQPAPVVGDQP